MKKSLAYTLPILLLIVFASCEDVIFPTLEEAPPQLVVDAWLNNKSEEQVINLNLTQNYYNASFPPGVSNANVFIIDSDGKRFDFEESNERGVYTWQPNATDTVLGVIGNDYELTIEVDEYTLTAASSCNRVPEIDSIVFRFEPETFLPEGYYAGFFARDPVGPGDSYWIKAYKNGNFLNKPNELNIAFDAGFTAGGNVDGINFIQPIRDGINPLDQDENDNFIPPYDPGDSVYVEIHSITNEAFQFLNEMIIQIDRPGGFGELFATPLANIPTNIQTEGGNPEAPAIGFFCVSAVSSGGERLDPDNLPPRN